MQKKMLWFSVLIVGVLMSFLPFYSFVKDDMFISANYARSLVHGEGLTFAQERVEGFSNFAWVMVGTIPHLFEGGADVMVWFYRILSIIAAVFVGVGVMRLGAQYIRVLPQAGENYSTRLITHAPALAAFALLCATSIGYYIASGMETIAFTALCVWVLVYVGDHKYHAALAMSVLAALTRPEGHIFVLVAAVATIGFVFRHQRFVVAIWSLLKYAMIPITVLTSYHAWRWSYYGDLLPNTYYIKSSSGGLMSMGFDDLFKVFDLQAFIWFPLLSLFAVMLVTVQSPRIGLRLGAHWLLGLFFFAYLVWVGGDEMAHGRMLLPGLAIMAALAGVAIWLVLTRVSKAWIVPIFSLMFVGVVCASLYETRRVSAEYRTWYEDMKASQGALCQDLATALPKGALVAYQDMGFCPYITEDRLRFIDYIGLVTRPVAMLRHKLQIPMFGVVPIVGQDSGSRRQQFWGQMCDLIFQQEPSAIALLLRVDQPRREIMMQRDMLSATEFKDWIIRNTGSFGFSPGLQWDTRFQEYEIRGVFPRDQSGGHIYLVSFVRRTPIIAQVGNSL